MTRENISLKQISSFLVYPFTTNIAPCCSTWSLQSCEPICSKWPSFLVMVEQDPMPCFYGKLQIFLLALLPSIEKLLSFLQPPEMLMALHPLFKLNNIQHFCPQQLVDYYLVGCGIPHAIPLKAKRMHFMDFFSNNVLYYV